MKQGKFSASSITEWELQNAARKKADRFTNGFFETEQISSARTASRSLGELKERIAEAAMTSSFEMAITMKDIASSIARIAMSPGSMDAARIRASGGELYKADATNSVDDRGALYNADSTRRATRFVAFLVVDFSEDSEMMLRNRLSIFKMSVNGFRSAKDGDLPDLEEINQRKSLYPYALIPEICFIYSIFEDFIRAVVICYLQKKVDYIIHLLCLHKLLKNRSRSIAGLSKSS